MRIQLKNEYGTFEMGGANHTAARVIEAQGFGVPAKETNNVVFEGQPGRITTGYRDRERTITISIDFSGAQNEIEKLYRIIYYPVDIICFFGTRRRRIRGMCVNATDFEKIIYHRLQKAVLQFVCDDPYFHDITSIKAQISKKNDIFPNLYEDGEWYVSLPAVATERAANEGVIVNKGDTVVYPVVRIENLKTSADTAQINGVSVTNHTTGEKISLDYDIKPQEVIVIDVPKRKITSSISGNITNTMSDDTVLGNFFFTVGQNLVSAESLDASDDISVTFEYTNNYIAAVI